MKRKKKKIFFSASKARSHSLFRLFFGTFTRFLHWARKCLYTPLILYLTFKQWHIASLDTYCGPVISMLMSHWFVWAASQCFFFLASGETIRFSLFKLWTFSQSPRASRADRFLYNRIIFTCPRVYYCITTKCSAILAKRPVFIQTTGFIGQTLSINRLGTTVRLNRQNEKAAFEAEPSISSWNKHLHWQEQNNCKEGRKW